MHDLIYTLKIQTGQFFSDDITINCILNGLQNFSFMHSIFSKFCKGTTLTHNNKAA